MPRFEYGLMLLFLGADICITGSFYPALYFAVALLHEVGHLFCMRHRKLTRQSIRFVGFGIVIDEKAHLSYRTEMAVCLAGPLFNLILATICFVIFTITGMPFWQQGMYANGFYALLNILPIAPLDGYKIVTDFIMLHATYPMALRIQKVIVCSGIALLCIGAAMLIFFEFYNFSLLFIMLALLFNEIIYLIRE